MILCERRSPFRFSLITRWYSTWEGLIISSGSFSPLASCISLKWLTSNWVVVRLGMKRSPALGVFLGVLEPLLGVLCAPKYQNRKQSLKWRKRNMGGGDGNLFQLASLTLVDIEVSTLLKWSFSGLGICFLQTVILYTYSTESTQHVQL